MNPIVLARFNVTRSWPWLRRWLRPTVYFSAGLAVGLVIGLVVLGWWLWPVEWVGGGPQDMAVGNQELYVRIVADLYAYQLSETTARQALDWNGWRGDVVACRMAATPSTNPADRLRLIAVAAAVNGVGCPDQFPSMVKR
ncbi:MAG: hypothetical protein L0332_06765 [Chloroflexi bacterium]|nr:hypothetical protein [Chloroflexota bacterium]